METAVVVLSLVVGALVAGVGGLTFYCYLLRRDVNKLDEVVTAVVDTLRGPPGK